jgi:hypothetical protein
MCIYDISLNSFLNEKCFRKKSYNVKIYILCSVTFVFEYRAVFLDNVEKQVQRTGHKWQYNAMPFACRMTKSRHTLRIYISLVFPWLERVGEHASVLGSIYITSVISTTGASSDLQVLDSHFVLFIVAASLWSTLVWLPFMWYNTWNLQNTY